MDPVAVLPITVRPLPRHALSPHSQLCWLLGLCCPTPEPRMSFLLFLSLAFSSSRYRTTLSNRAKPPIQLTSVIVEILSWCLPVCSLTPHPYQTGSQNRAQPGADHHADAAPGPKWPGREVGTASETAHLLPGQHFQRKLKQLTSQGEALSWNPSISYRIQQFTNISTRLSTLYGNLNYELTLQ